MDNSKVSNNSKSECINNVSGRDRYSKLILLKRCIKDVDEDTSNLRNFANSVSNEIIVANEKIASFLSANQKRIELLKELDNKIALNEYKKSCYIEEFMDLVPLDVIKDYYNGCLAFVPFDKINTNCISNDLLNNK